MQKKNKFSIILEYAWLILAIVSFALAIHKTILFGFQESLILYAIAIISLGMYFFKKEIRRKSLKEEDEGQQ